VGGRRTLAVWALIAALGVPLAASAAVITGTPRADRLRGTIGADRIFGAGGADVVSGLAGNDLLDGGAGRDTLAGGLGADRINAAFDNGRDTARCGRGADLVDADLRDRVAADCEVVARQLSSDASADPEAQHQTQVEPASFASGSTIVTAFQSGRFFDGGSATIGFSTSTDAGRTWRSGFLPGITVASRPAGSDLRASDPTVAYDALHRVWLIVSLGIGANRWDLAVSRSGDGRAWSAPVLAVAGPPESIDKEWVACDNWPSSPFRGRCYLSYLDLHSSAIATSTSTDGGVTWSPPVLGTPSQTDINGAQPVAQPDGSLVVVYGSFSTRTFEESEILAIRSRDGGATFSPPTRVAVLQEAQVRGVRTLALPTIGIDGGGRLFAAWQDCRFSSSCARNDLVLTSSADGITWSDPQRIPTTGSGGSVHSLIPGLGVDPATAGATAHLAFVYYTLGTSGRLDVATISSSDGGSSWGRPQRLDVESMPLNWIAETRDGAMVGDYMALSYANGRAVPVFSLAWHPAAGPSLRQAIFARARG
jgi:hypothetical protein